MRFDGEAVDPILDGPRLGRQLAAVRDYCLGLNGGFATLRQISEAVGSGEASVSAQLRNLRKEKFGSFIVERCRGSGGLFFYRVLRPKPEQLPLPLAG